ncbi:Dolichyl-diphosphooligosaccharide--protein glycosyltransferase subunit SWP1 [Wickerhamiella sorbophila]|uniref:Dolichyl-diphosphooligosaccharide--protein glycosyltransferase subunit SWP1 n=1 Tax=Wickerhamiella sorbophila TaxID=45607 RepID=A0A2T0FC96_9ASCO|nr:Dolichyl-diphosphooligosaccharide--protein glycosyltransferase subunit SWP1 [Wickerhamiella sorbophila]PRT52585.1 Dolichyl-diphosphooligosaccharide--protein glycosyltransferase subunit SWP1 [Wickerhamiella sorbophila]
MLFGLFSIVLASPALAWSVTNAKVGIALPGDPGELVSLADAGVIELGPSRTLNVAWEIPEAPPLPRQNVLRLYNDKCDHTVSAKVRGKKAKAVVAYHSLPACLSGPVKADIYVAGGSEGQAASSREVFSLQVQEISTPELDSRYQRPLAVEPEIIHQFRPEPRMVKAPVALVFVAVIDILFVTMVSLWAKNVGIKFAALDFTLALAAIESVFVAYFISASIFTALSAVACLAPLAFFTGQRALRKEHSRRNGSN